MKLLWYYLAAINLIAAAVTFFDKRAARRHRERVPEATLLFLAAVGGAAGEYLAMLLARHKTRKPKFAVGVPLMLLAQAALIVWLAQGGVLT